MQTIKLNNGVEMPQMGYGVFQVSPLYRDGYFCKNSEILHRKIVTI